ncbi:unnamed protein product [Ectocarpus sp. 13 AM-2016]
MPRTPRRAVERRLAPGIKVLRRGEFCLQMAPLLAPSLPTECGHLGSALALPSVASGPLLSHCTVRVYMCSILVAAGSAAGSAAALRPTDARGHPGMTSKLYGKTDTNGCQEAHNDTEGWGRFCPEHLPTKHDWIGNALGRGDVGWGGERHHPLSAGEVVPVLERTVSAATLEKNHGHVIHMPVTVLR